MKNNERRSRNTQVPTPYFYNCVSPLQLNYHEGAFYFLPSIASIHSRIWHKGSLNHQQNPIYNNNTLVHQLSSQNVRKAVLRHRRGRD